MLKVGETPKLEEAVRLVTDVDREISDRAQKRLDSLTKPRGSLGRLEEFAKTVAAITGDVRPSIRSKTIFTFAADHGVAEENVSAFPKEVTAQMVYNFLAGGAGINVLARHAGARVIVIDIGVDHDFGDLEGLVKRKVVRGSGNIRRGPAMTRNEALQCIDAGIELAGEYAGVGAIYGTGDMGIANTTPSSAVISALTGLPPEAVTGRGTGIDDAAYRHKIEVIEDALRVNRPDPSDPVDVLSKVGGPEIGGIAGLIIGAASRKIPVVVDGFISTAGALIAAGLNPAIKDYFFISHNSAEKGHHATLEWLNARPVLDLGLRLGEGTGAALAMTVIEAGVKIYNEMATFGEAGVSEENA